MLSTQNEPTPGEDPEADASNPAPNEAVEPAKSDLPAVPDAFKGYLNAEGGLDYDKLEADFSQGAEARKAAEERAQNIPEKFEIAVPEDLVGEVDAAGLEAVKNAQEWVDLHASLTDEPITQTQFDKIQRAFWAYSARAHVEQQEAEKARQDEAMKELAPKGTADADQLAKGEAEFERIRNALKNTVGEDVIESLSSVAGLARLVDRLLQKIQGPSGGGPVTTSTPKSELPPQAVAYPDDYRGAR